MMHGALLQNKPPGAQFWTFILLFFTSLLVFSLLASLAIIPFAGIEGLQDMSVGGDYSDPRLVLGLKVAQVISVAGAFILPSFVFALLVSTRPLDYLKLNRFPSPLLLLLCVVLVLSAMPLVNAFAELNSRMDLPEALGPLERWMKASEERAEALTKAFLIMDGVPDLLFNLFIIAFLAAVGEELLFRGVIQQLLVKYTRNTHLAVWVTAILFSAIHLQFYGFVPRMLLGALLGYAFVWTNSLWVPMFIHFTNNGMAVLLAYLAGKKIIPGETETIGANASDMLFLVLSGIVFLLVLSFIYSLAKKRRYPDPA